MKNILIVGGSYGIGYALAKELCKDNSVYTVSRTFENPEKINAVHIPFDAASEILNIQKIPTVLDGFVFCPGSINLKPFKNLNHEDFTADFNVNFLNMVKVLQLVMPNLLIANNPAIVLFSSVAAAVGLPFHTSVAASKGAVEGFAKALAA